jgi:hypothetical protein
MLLNPTSKNINIDKRVVNNTKAHVINCDPEVPIFLPKNPDISEPIKGNNINVIYII